MTQVSASTGGVNCGEPGAATTAHRPPEPNPHGGPAVMRDDSRPIPRSAKRAIPEATRRAIAERYGCRPFHTVPAQCAYCGADGTVAWTSRTWVHFQGLELDHVVPEFHGGDESASNIVLACRRCNRSKGHRIDWQVAS